MKYLGQVEDNKDVVDKKYVDDKFNEIDVMTGATSESSGESGLVPTPSAGDQYKVLRGDGTWIDISGGSGYLPLSGGTITGNIYTTPYYDATIENPEGGQTLIVSKGHSTKGTPPSEDEWHTMVMAIDNSGNTNNLYKYGQVETAVRTDGRVYTTLQAYKNEADSTSNASIIVGYDANGNVYTSAPTPVAGDNSTKIATTAWVNTKLKSNYPTINRSGMISIAENTDLNTLTTAGTYYTTGGNSGSAIHQTLINSPTNGSGGGFMMYVVAQGADANSYPKQIIYMYNGDIYERTRDSSTWGAWHKRAYTDSDITGNAATATTATNANALNNLYTVSTRPASANTCYADGKLRTYLATSKMTTGKPPTDAHILHLAWDNSKYDGQIALSTSGGNLYWRTQDSSDTWGSWQTAAKSDHTHSYLPLSGGTMTGSITLNNSGSAIVWKAPSSIICNATANNQEWSFDLSPSTYTGTYWHIYSSKNSKSILQCYTDDNSVKVPNGDFIPSSLVMDVSGTTPVVGTGITLPFKYKSKTTASGNAVYETSPFFALPTSDTANNGVGFGIGTGGAIVIGAGESAKALASAIPINGGTENVYISADSTINFYTNCNTIANRRVAILNTNVEFHEIDDSITRGTAPSSAYNCFLISRQSAGSGSTGNKYMAGVYKSISTSNVTGTYLYDYPNTSTTSTSIGVGGHSIGICHDASGNAYTYAPTPNSNSNTTHIATTEWVRTYATPSNIGAAASSHTHNYAGSASAGGPATSVAIAAGTTNEARYVWFSYAGTGNEGKACYDADFKYNPSTNNLTVTKINSVTVGSSPKFTDTNNAVTKTSITYPSSATNYYLVADSTEATATGGLSKFGTNARVQVTAGTTSVEGKTAIILGNSTATGTANNQTGYICLYGSGGKYSQILPHSGDTTNRTIYTPKSDGTLVCHTTNTAIGSASKPVYVTANGVATACTSLETAGNVVMNGTNNTNYLQLPSGIKLY